MLAIPHLLLSRALPASFGHFQTTLPPFSFKAPNSMNFKGISEQVSLFYRVILSPSLPSFLGPSPPSIGYFSSCLIIFPSVSALAIHYDFKGPLAEPDKERPTRHQNPHLQEALTLRVEQMQDGPPLSLTARLCPCLRLIPTLSASVRTSQLQ